jgi:hypothetical protein
MDGPQQTHNNTQQLKRKKKKKKFLLGVCFVNIYKHAAIERLITCWEI